MVNGEVFYLKILNEFKRFKSDFYGMKRKTKKMKQVDTE